MKELPKLSELSEGEKDALIEALWKELQELRQKVEGKGVKKTSRNSSEPPSKGFKANTESVEEGSGVREGSVGRKGGGRELSEKPDQIVVAKACRCPNCGAGAEQLREKLSAVYERIELPRVRPIVTRVERYGGTCQSCQQSYQSAVPLGLEEGSPYGNSVAMVVSYLRYSQAVSYERLSQLMENLYGLKISEGAIANLLKRVNQKLEAPVQRILERIQSARIVGSDETSARVNGKNQWEWVFQNEDVCFHIIRPSRGKSVIDEVMGSHRPEVWVSDLYSAQKAHPAKDWQICLAHQLRDCQFAIEAGDSLFAPEMKRLILRGIALGRRQDKIAESTLNKHRNKLKRLLHQILELKPENEAGQKLIARYRRLKRELLLFLDFPGIPPTNNASEQALRPSVIFRKVTNCFRSDWGAELFTRVRSVFDTAQRQAISNFDSLLLSFNSPNLDWLGG
jgi:transposase